MNRDEFLAKFANVLQTEDEIKFDDHLEDIEEWDSLSKMATIALLNQEFSVKVTMSDIKQLKTIEDIAQKAGF